MKYILESDFDKTYDELSNLNTELIYSWPTKEELIEKGAETHWQSLAIPENSDSGLYVIKRNDTNQLYIGKASELEDRRRDHFKGTDRDSRLLHNEIKGIRNKYETQEEADKAIADLFSWCRLATLNGYSKEEIADLEYKAISEVYKTCRPIFGGNDYNYDAGGIGGHPFSYADDPEVYNRIALYLSRGYSEPEIVNKLNNWKYFREKGYVLKSDSIVSEINKNPKAYKDVIKDYDKLIDPETGKFRSTDIGRKNNNFESGRGQSGAVLVLYKEKGNWKVFANKTALYHYLYPNDKDPKAHAYRLKENEKIKFIKWTDIDNRFKDSTTGEYTTRDYWNLVRHLKDNTEVPPSIVKKILVLAGIED